MHDLVHDLALSMAQIEVSSFDRDSNDNVQHIWFDFSEHSASQLPNHMGHLRTLMFDPYGEPMAGGESFIAKSISNSKHLRLLCCNLDQLLNKVRYSNHLKHLSLTANRTLGLPDSVCNLQRLETLNLLEELPKDIRYLISLRELLLRTRQTSLQGNGIGCLTSLRTLLL
ncbi:hypothetical protein HRI_003859100 [Hibiscus trionum]|uniref:Uncharacterized protein n=1 Tax=Hibiscus trionum TaxID=183268 RepID=A0A9W7MHB5_HIBTR|nr:hypothetical protein HRI_003859100 [Hibiscus trionum]